MAVPRRWMIWGAVATTVLVVHFAFQFLAWGYHPGNSVPGSGRSDIPWRVASFPLFLLFGHRDVAFFWVAMVANSLIWSVALTLVAKVAFETKEGR
jgi:hypothetical protein